jgi:hypothetical protein
MIPSPDRVAARFLAAREWGDTTKMVSDYRSALSAFQASVASVRGSVAEAYSRFSLTPSAVDRSTAKAIGEATSRRLSYSMVPLIKAARPLADWVIQTKVIPPSKAKSIEMIARVVGSMARLPKDILDWSEKNGDRLNVLLEAASWPERSGSDDSAASQVATVGPLKVHNTIGANDKQFKEILGLVENAVRALSTTRDFKKVLYGDLFVVGQLRQSNTLAWYNVSNDEVYVRSLAKKGYDGLHALTHELGHRYWYKFTSHEVKKSISTLYAKTKAAAAWTPSWVFSPGDQIPIKVRGVRGTPVVDRVDDTFYYFTQGGQMAVRDVNRLLLEFRSFPSMYAASSVEEFFAECFSFYTMGKLKPELTEGFLAALG